MITYLERENLVFYKYYVKKLDVWRNLNGIKCKEGMNKLYRHISFNTFASQPTEIPRTAIKIKTPNNNWLKLNYYDNDKKAIKAKKLPQYAHGFCHNIDHEGITLYKVYNNPEGVFVYSLPDDGYIDWESQMNSKVNFNLFYQKLRLSITNPVEFYVAQDRRLAIDGNGILVYLGDTKYVFLGTLSYYFKIDDEIVGFYSNFGTSLVSYPILETKKYIVFLFTKEVVSKEHLKLIPRFPIFGKRIIDWSFIYEYYRIIPKILLKKLEFRDIVTYSL